LNKANAEVERLKQEIHKTRVNASLLNALEHVIEDLELRANMKIGVEKGSVDVSNDVYVNAKWAIELAKEIKKEQQ
jgi:hypothetical protein